MEIEIVTKKEFRIVGLKVVAPVSRLGIEVPEAQKVFRNLETPTSGTSKGIYGVGPMRNITENPNLHTIYVGTEVSNVNEVPEGMVELTVPEQKYAFITYKGPMVDSWKVYGELFNWIENSGLTKNIDSYSIEFYDENHNWEDKNTPNNSLDIYIPIL